ncbi:hypothetical protein D3C72_2209110 [compost metagenome]
MLSQRKDGLKTRLYLKLKHPGAVEAQVHPESHQIWLDMPNRAPAEPVSPAADLAPEDMPEATPETRD